MGTFRCINTSLDVAGLPTAATFCSGRTSKLISYGLSSPPQLVVYEISSKTVKKRLPLPDNGVPCNLTQILWSPKDTHIAVGTSQGSVMVLNYRTYSFSRDLAGHDDLPIRSLTFKDNYLATTDDSGRFAVYDWERESLLHCFEKLHAGPAFDGDISPINSKLMASVGLDKRLQFVDPFIPKVVSTQHLEEPGTAVAFHPMGYQLVVGHSDGSFALIDIRTWKTLLSAVHGQSSSVNSVRFFSDAMIKRMTRSTPGLNTSVGGQGTD
ncbi:unnamed protein product [Cyprideis torosa]|uniref:Uncharacterized protein n=1 Tax=Cyprideis torosa TaxID=163714 RepID=A0A7R8ZUT4_9CRUS|nr:unnamed protein product [Cyprideis torosa]CAG0901451.1 unnamed protein product [Cyprideis torosa]